jgi:hypothetical protein
MQTRKDNMNKNDNSSEESSSESSTSKFFDLLINGDLSPYLESFKKLIKEQDEEVKRIIEKEEEDEEDEEEKPTHSYNLRPRK